MVHAVERAGVPLLSLPEEEGEAQDAAASASAKVERECRM